MTDVAAIIVTRGDQDLEPVVASLPEEWDVVIWDNAREERDLSVYGRYAAIARTDADLIYVQDDDCIVSDPQAIVDVWLAGANHTVERDVVGGAATWPSHVHPRGSDVVVCNMPQEFRHEFYEDHALVGFGAAFHRDAPERAFRQFWVETVGHDVFYRTCDIVFTALTPRVVVDVPHEDMPWAHYESRMWKQPGHLAERVRMLDLVRQFA